jgi:hypothetical protein
MLKCQTVACAMGDESHALHPDGIPVVCGYCGVEMTGDD